MESAKVSALSWITRVSQDPEARVYREEKVGGQRDTCLMRAGAAVLVLTLWC